MSVWEGTQFNFTLLFRFIFIFIFIFILFLFYFLFFFWLRFRALNNSLLDWSTACDIMGRFWFSVLV